MAVQTHGPNVFEFVHEDTKITFSPGALDHNAVLDYSGPMGRYRFSGDEIQSCESARGLEVSVTLDQVSHLRTTTLTVFVPELELDDAAERTFRTVGIHATHRRAINGRLGVALSSEPLEFDGLARLVEFRSAESPQLL